MADLQVLNGAKNCLNVKVRSFTWMLLQTFSHSISNIHRL